MHKITIPENSSSNCFDSVFYSLLKFFKFDYEAYNIKYFYTDYYNNITHCICRGKSNENILKDIYGIDLIFKDRDRSSDLSEIVCNSINSRIVGIVIDPYYCYWSPFYHQSHYWHTILIVGVDYHTKKYICFDVHFNLVGYIEADFAVINKYFERYYTFNFKETNEVRLELMIDKIKVLLNSFDNNINMKKAEMINYFVKTDKKALFPENLKTSVPLINLMWIAEDKKNFSIALRHIENKIGKLIFFPVYELLSISEQNFLLLKSMLIRYAITGALIEDNLRNIINRIFDTDAMTIGYIKNILGDIA